jgi:hypothetical protein
MNCREATDTLTDLMEEGLSRAKRRRLERHRLSCTSCAAYRQTYEMTVELERAAFDSHREVAPVRVPDSLVAAILLRRRLAVPLCPVK